MKESEVEAHIRKHLLRTGWKLTTDVKRPGEHGIDIAAYHPRRCRLLRMEVKGGSGKHKGQELHSSFYNVLGQLLSRMDIQGNHPKKGRVYALGIPYAWEAPFRKKILKMKYGWTLLKLRVFLVKSSGEVFEKPYSYFL